MVADITTQATWPVIGHERVVRLLQQSIRNERLSHAYLFVGPAGVGKTTLARTLAQAVLCQAEDVATRPCGQCRACQLIAQDRHPDVRMVAPPGPGRALGIDQVRALQREASLSPMEAPWKVFIVCELDRATPQAANALLKTLEEPPPQVLLLLTAHQREALLPTVLSRCQVITLRPLPVETVEAALRERWQVPPEEAALWARLSGGCPGKAVNALADENARVWRLERLLEMQQVLAAGWGTRLQWAEKLSQRPDEVRATLALWLSWWRDVMLVQARCADQITHIDQRAALEEAAQQWTADQVRETVRRLWDTLQYIEANANVRLALETLFLFLPRSQ